MARRVIHGELFPESWDELDQMVRTTEEEYTDKVPVKPVPLPTPYPVDTSSSKTKSTTTSSSKKKTAGKKSTEL